MTTAEYISVGKVGKTYGTGGALKLHPEEPYTEAVLQAAVLFIPVAGKPAPFFVEEYLSADPLVVKLEEVEDREEAHPLSGQPLFLRQQDLPTAGEEEEDYRVMIGYTIHDEAAGEVGVIRDIMELPEQVLAVLDYEGREILIPINEHFIRSFDLEQRLILMDLPEGLLDL